MAEAIKLLRKLTSYVNYYSHIDSPERTLAHFGQIATFINALRSRRRVSISVWYFQGDRRSDYDMDFNNFTEAWRFLVKNYASLQGGGVDVAYTDDATLIFDTLWDLSLPTPQSESEGPLNDFLVNELIICATGVPQLCHNLLIPS